VSERIFAQLLPANSRKDAPVLQSLSPRAATEHNINSSLDSCGFWRDPSLMTPSLRVGLPEKLDSALSPLVKFG